ncbi:MAG: winged helix-turn-helix domain-containing protein [Balneolaceae bacterium]|nr:winged helix-turn-helix domain-containing protein [Balneolaceae bacterium]
MRSVAKSNSSLKVPLNDILGYQANIRVLRYLTIHPASVSYSELAKQTGITLPGIHKTVKRLIETGIIVYAGSGKQQLITLRTEHPLSGIITELFKKEDEYFKKLKKSIKNQIDRLQVEIFAAWIYGKVADGCDEYGDPLQIAVLGKADTVDRAAEELRNYLFKSDIEADFDVTIELNGMTPADLEVSKKTLTGRIIHLYGMDPIIYAEGRGFFTEKAENHQNLDKRSQLAGKAWGTVCAPTS